MPMNAYPAKELYTAEDLVAIITRLRDPDAGCPWDKVQTHRSIRMNFLEEAYEAVDAIDLEDPHLLCEELGDVLMQVVFHTCIEQEAGHFTWQQVCDGVCRKLIARHPHIFGGDASIKDWDALKNKEKGRLTLQDDLDSVPRALPAWIARRGPGRSPAVRGNCRRPDQPPGQSRPPGNCCSRPWRWPAGPVWTRNRPCSAATRLSAARQSAPHKSEKPAPEQNRQPLLADKFTLEVQTYDES